MWGVTNVIRVKDTDFGPVLHSRRSTIHRTFMALKRLIKQLIEFRYSRLNTQINRSVTNLHNQSSQDRFANLSLIQHPWDYFILHFYSLSFSQ
jgi:hypothetical protein